MSRTSVISLLLLALFASAVLCQVPPPTPQSDSTPVLLGSAPTIVAPAEPVSQPLPEKKQEKLETVADVILPPFTLLLQQADEALEQKEKKNAILHNWKKDIYLPLSKKLKPWKYIPSEAILSPVYCSYYKQMRLLKMALDVVMEKAKKLPKHKHHKRQIKRQAWGLLKHLKRRMRKFRMCPSTEEEIAVEVSQAHYKVTL